MAVLAVLMHLAFNYKQLEGLPVRAGIGATAPAGTPEAAAAAAAAAAASGGKTPTPPPPALMMRAASLPNVREGLARALFDMLPGDIVADTKNIARDLTQRQSSGEALLAEAGAGAGASADATAGLLGDHQAHSSRTASLALIAAGGGGGDGDAGEASPLFSAGGGWAFQQQAAHAPPASPRRG